MDSDEIVAERVKKGDTEAYGILVSRYEPKISRYAKKFLYDKEDVSDSVQDTFIKAYINIQSFDSNQKFSPWLYRIAHNTFVNEIKRKSKQPFSFFDFSTDTFIPFRSDESSEADASQRISKGMIEKCLNVLKREYREILVLSYFEELSYKEISEILKIPVSTVGVRIRRAKEQIRKNYENKYGKYE